VTDPTKKTYSPVSNENGNECLEVLQLNNWNEDWGAEKHPKSGHVFYIHKTSHDLVPHIPSATQTTYKTQIAISTDAEDNTTGTFFVGPHWHDRMGAPGDNIPRVWFDHFLNKVGVPLIKSDKIIPVVFMPPITANLIELRTTNEKMFQVRLHDMYHLHHHRYHYYHHRYHYHHHHYHHHHRHHNYYHYYHHHHQHHYHYHNTTTTIIITTTTIIITTTTTTTTITITITTTTITITITTTIPTTARNT
jgi:hypothetical protein